MIDLLIKYKEITERQKTLLENDEIDKAILLMNDKEKLFMLIQDAKTSVEGAGEQSLSKEIAIEVAHIIRGNDEIMELMRKQQNRIADSMHSINNGRLAHNAYESFIQPDAHFVDKKK